MNGARPASQRGLTIIELVVVMVLVAVIAAGVASIVGPSVQSYSAVKLRAQMTDESDTAVRRMVNDIQRAVPNSIRSPNNKCFELIPAVAGGRYRMAADTSSGHDSAGCAPSATCSAPLDTTKSTTVFDSLSALPLTPASGDWVVVNNQNSNDVYDGYNRSAITGFVAAPAAWMGAHRISINAKQFSQGYDGGRYLIVPNNQRAVFYVCSGADGTTDASGNGKGVLYRLKNYGFNSAYPAACPSVVGADVILKGIVNCTVTYNPNQGSTQQSGYLLLDLDLSRNSEAVHLTMGAHVSNAP
jgi:MSHA biogenesis protein MshO